MGKLSDWVDEKSDFLVIVDGESTKVIFLGYELTKSTFGKETVRYKFDTEFGEKYWDSSAKNIALFFDKLKKGQKVRITRTGEGTDTKYKPELVDE